MFYRVYLTVRDSSGLTHTSSVDVRPLTSVVRIESNVANAQLTLDGAPITAPFSFTGVEGVIRTLGVVTPQTSGGTTYEFVSWSDGGQATHEIATPNDDTTFTALFQPAATTTVFSDNFEASARLDARRRARNTATRGLWQRGDPQPTTSNGVTLQLGTCDGPSVNCFVTGSRRRASAVGPATWTTARRRSSRRRSRCRRAAPSLCDSATTSRTTTTRPARTTSAFAWWGQRYDRRRYSRARARAARVVGGAWTTQTVNISAFAGQTVRLRFEAADAAAGSIIEAGFDNVSVTRQ